MSHALLETERRSLGRDLKHQAISSSLVSFFPFVALRWDSEPPTMLERSSAANPHFQLGSLFLFFFPPFFETRPSAGSPVD